MNSNLRAAIKVDRPGGAKAVSSLPQENSWSVRWSQQRANPLDEALRLDVSCRRLHLGIRGSRDRTGLILSFVFLLFLEPLLVVFEDLCLTEPSHNVAPAFSVTEDNPVFAVRWRSWAIQTLR